MLQTIHRGEVVVAADLYERSDIHIGLSPNPHCMGMFLHGPGVDIAVRLSWEQARCLYAQLHLRLVMAPHLERRLAEAMAAASPPAPAAR